MTSILEPRNVGDIIGETFKVYGRNFLALLVIAIIYILVVVIWGWLSIQIDLMTKNFAIGLLVTLFISLVVFPLVIGSLIYGVAEQYFLHPIGVGRAYGFSLKRLGAIIGALMLFMLGIFGMWVTIIGIPFAVYFMIRWLFCLPAALLEGVGPRAALSRSSALVKGNWWRVLGILIVIDIVVSVIALPLSFILNTIVLQNYLIGLIVGGIVGALLMPILSTGFTLLYFDLRVRKEGYSLEALAQELNIKTDSNIA